MVNGELPADHALTPEARRGMTLRAQMLADKLLPAGPEMASLAIAPTVIAMIPRSGDEGEHKARMAVYINDLAELPAWALAEACARFRQGKVGDGKFLPTPGEIAVEARWLMQPFARARHDIERVLAARVAKSPELTADERKAVVARLRPMIEKLAPSPAQTATAPPSDPEAEIAALKSRCAAPIPVGEGLARTLGEARR
jgi:hypothetical protein